MDATGITLSRNQHAHVQRLIHERGLAGLVRMQLVDYRELHVHQPFDKIASVGMFEHVGRAQMGRYFNTVARLLRPGGLVPNHGITAGGVDNAQLGAGMGDFIEQYIFPGGELLHVSTVLQDLARAGLEMVDTENLRPHYARTLWEWSDGLEARLPAARGVLAAQAGAEQADKVLRAYRLYLAGSALGFDGAGWRCTRCWPSNRMATPPGALYPAHNRVIPSPATICTRPVRPALKPSLKPSPKTFLTGL